MPRPAIYALTWDFLDDIVQVHDTDRTHHEIRPNGSSPHRGRRHGRDHCHGRALRLCERAEGARTHHAHHTDAYVASRCYSAAAGHACSAAAVAGGEGDQP